MARTFETAVPQLVGLADLGTFVNEAGKDELVNKAAPLALRRVASDDLNRYGPRWIVSAVRLDTGELVAIGMPKNPTRDAQFAYLRDALADPEGDEFAPVVLIRVGRKDAMTFRTATSAELAAALPPAGPEPAPEATPKLAKAGR